jgi:YVTN family beta-propeller protein
VSDDIGDRKSLRFPKHDKEGGSMHGLAVAPAPGGAGFTVYFSSTAKSLLSADVAADGTADWSSRKIALPGTYNLGVALSPDGKLAYVCMSARNALGVVDLASGKMTAEVPVGVSPYGVALSPDGHTAYVTNFGGRPPAAGHRKADSYGTDVSVDGRSIPDSGTVSRVDLRASHVVGEIAVGLHPTQIVRDAAGRRYYVANANSDTVSVIDAATNHVVDTVSVHPDPGLPYGSIPDALAISPDGNTLYVANAGNDAVAVVPVDALPAKPAGFIPAGWFPGAVTATADQVFIANAKSGNVTRVAAPPAEQLARYTAQVLADGQVPLALREMERGSKTVPPVPVPAHPGDPSVFRHVVYVLKENKTYDQVLGDIGRGNSDPKLCVYGRQVTPNHHALANQFVLLDNYYCNGVNSSDGHQWATQGIIGEYFEKGARTYDFGTDCLCYAGSDFIWDSCLLHGLSIRNYGEFDFPLSVPKSRKWFDIYRDWDKSGQQMFRQSLQLQTLMQYTCHQYPGWNLSFPDACRIKVYLSELAGFERSGTMPDFTLLYLPQDHTSGTGATVPTPRAMVADNDLALGQAVAALSRTRFWKDTVIFVNEDDPQSGYDHVDGHRSFCLVASPYTKRGAIVSHFYNQTSVLQTMTRILGLPPLNQACAESPTMEDCFTDKPDLRPYDVLANEIPLDERNKPKAAMAPAERALADAVDAMDFTLPDRADDDKLNRLNWFASGRTEPYPAEFAGAHGRGLAALHLKLDPAHGKDDDGDGDDDDDDKKGR